MNNMNLPDDVEFYEDIRLIVWRPRGLVNKSAVNKIITVIGELETTAKEPFNRFSDTVAADAVDLNFEYIIQVSLYRRAFTVNVRRSNRRFSPRIHLIHYGKVHALLTQGSPINVRVFQERKEAAQWSGVTSRNTEGGRGPVSLNHTNQTNDVTVKLIKHHGRAGVSWEGKAKTMKLPLPPDVEFHEDICLLIHPHGR